MFNYNRSILSNYLNILLGIGKKRSLINDKKIFLGHKTNSLKIVNKAKLYTNSIHGLNSPANDVAEFLIGKNCLKEILW